MTTTIPDHPVCEKTETIAFQMKWLADGKRACVYVPEGGYDGEIPKGTRVFKCDDGATLYVNPRLLGFLLGYGIAEKPKLEETIGAVVIRSQDGVEKQAVVVDQKSVHDVMMASLRLLEIGDTIAVEKTDDVINRRTE